MQETKSEWESVTKCFRDEKPIQLGRYVSYWYHKTPRRMLHCLSYYKFAAKLIGNSKRVLELGCNEGLGTWVVAKECGFAKGIDFDEEAIVAAKKNFTGEQIEFSTEDVLQSTPAEEWDAVINFDVIEHILPENAEKFLSSMAAHLKPHGLAIVGTPSLISQQFASAFAQRGHINIYSHERLEEEMRKHFEFVFMFAGNDEVVHTGFMPLAHYFIAVGCKKR